MTNYDTTSVKALLSSYTATDFQNFANDCLFNWSSAWTSRFTIDPNYLAAIVAATTWDQQAFVASLQRCAHDLTVGNTIDFSGLDIGGTPVANTTWTLHLDYQHFGGLFPILTSFWWTHKP